MRDVSNSTLALLSLLVIILTALGTWVLLESAPPAPAHSNTQGNVRLVILPPEEPTQSKSTGQVSLTLVPQ
ncbi:hypothetical protein HY642_07275 [Candidatus Woesearchaeota archaeon]|nr:hypothetical protein [Candidatus Woesearchaeota archaeon]